MAARGGGEHTNSKTIRSYDASTLCRRMREGNPCLYCYVNIARKYGFQAKKVIDYQPYNGFVQSYPQKLIDCLNALGGIRLFSYADYLPEHDKDISQLLDDCQARGLMAKAITKEEGFIARFHDHPAVSVIHVSIDSLKGSKAGRSPISNSRARALRNRYAKLLVRVVLLDWNDVIHYGSCDWADILTPNHKIIPNQRNRSFVLFSKAQRQQMGKDYPGRVCAASPSGKCKDCVVHCGAFSLDQLKQRPVHGRR